MEFCLEHYEIEHESSKHVMPKIICFPLSDLIHPNNAYPLRMTIGKIKKHL